MLRSLYLLTLISLLACSKDGPSPTAPAGKVVSLAKPTGLRIAPQSQSVIFRWYPSANADDYELSYMERGGAWVDVQAAPYSSPSYPEYEVYEWDLVWDTEHRVRLRAKWGDKKSEWVHSIWFIVNELVASGSSLEYPIVDSSVTDVNKPTGLRASRLSDTSVHLAWDAVVDATDYDVNYKAKDGKWTSSPHSGIATAHELSGLDAGVKYRWAVKADRGDSKSRWALSDWFTVDTLPSLGGALDTLPSPGFDIELVFLDDHPDIEVTAQHKELIRLAADRWEEIIVGDVPDTTMDGVRVSIHDVLFYADGLVDDIRIYVSFRPRNHRSDGAANSFTSYDWLRPNGLPFISFVTLKELPYLNNFEVPGDDWRVSQQCLYGVALHEIGHSLGIGSLWHHNVVVADDRHTFTGVEAVRQFDRMMVDGMGADYWRWPKVPLGDFAHWDGVAFSDIMAIGSELVISPISAGVLADLGYAVDMSKADYVGIILAYHSDRYFGGLLPSRVRASVRKSHEAMYGESVAGKTVVNSHSWCGVGALH